MSSPLFNIPPHKKSSFNKLPKLSNPSPVSIYNPNHNNSYPPNHQEYNNVYPMNDNNNINNISNVQNNQAYINNNQYDSIPSQKNNNNLPRRKPPPIDFRKIDGSHSFAPDTSSVSPLPYDTNNSNSEQINAPNPYSDYQYQQNLHAQINYNDTQHNTTNDNNVPFLTNNNNNNSNYNNNNINNNNNHHNNNNNYNNYNFNTSNNNDNPPFLYEPTNSSSTDSNRTITNNDSNHSHDNYTNDTSNEIIKNKEIDDMTPEDWNIVANNNKIIELDKLGEGNGGSVSKCKLRNSGSKIFALKLINADPNPDIQKQIIRELQYNRSCNSPNIVKYYGTFMIEKQSMIGIAMEFMGGKSLDAIYKKAIELDPTNRINEKVLGKIAESVLNGLNYLHQQKIIHRDIKPSNILLDYQGNIKLCDFGVSGEVINSLATTFVGTQYYMAPERIMGKPYTVTCDVWSLGLTLLEVASCKFPFLIDNDEMLGPIELLSLILEYEPKLNDLPEDEIFWTESFKNFINYCLKKNSNERPSPRQMLQHPWCIGQRKIKVRMDKFVKKLWGNELS